jgi:hypothetical protein
VIGAGFALPTRPGGASMVIGAASFGQRKGRPHAPSAAPTFHRGVSRHEAAMHSLDDVGGSNARGMPLDEAWQVWAPVPWVRNLDALNLALSLQVPPGPVVGDDRKSLSKHLAAALKERTAWVRLKIASARFQLSGRKYGDPLGAARVVIPQSHARDCAIDVDRSQVSFDDQILVAVRMREIATAVTDVIRPGSWYHDPHKLTGFAPLGLREHCLREIQEAGQIAREAQAALERLPEAVRKNGPPVEIVQLDATARLIEGRALRKLHDEFMHALKAGELEAHVAKTSLFGEWEWIPPARWSRLDLMLRPQIVIRDPYTRETWAHIRIRRPEAPLAATSEAADRDHGSTAEANTSSAPASAPAQSPDADMVPVPQDDATNPADQQSELAGEPQNSKRMTFAKVLFELKQLVEANIGKYRASDLIAEAKRKRADIPDRVLRSMMAELRKLDSSISAPGPKPGSNRE